MNKLYSTTNTLQNTLSKDPKWTSPTSSTTSPSRPLHTSRWLVPSTALLSPLLSRLTLGFSLFSLCLCFSRPRPPPEKLLLQSTNLSSTTLVQRETVSLMVLLSRSTCTTASRLKARLVSLVTMSRSTVMVCLERLELQRGY